MILFFSFCFGTIFGSFSSALAYRFFNDKVGFFNFKYSVCPKCKTRISPIDLIPIISYLFVFKGRCRHCKEKVHIGYLLNEIIMGTVFALIIEKFGVTYLGILFVIAMFLLITQSVIDLRKMLVSDILTVLLFTVCITMARLENHSWVEIFATSFLIFGVFLLIQKLAILFLKKDIVGFGDLKIFSAICIVFEPEVLVVFMMLCGIISLVLFVIFGKRKALPFLPSITFAFFIAFYFNSFIHQLLKW